MPLVGAWVLARRGLRAEPLRIAPARRLDLGVLLVASLYGTWIAVRGHVTGLDGLVLIALYVLYVRGVEGAEGEEPAPVGVSAGLAALPSPQRRHSLTGLLVGAAIVVLAVAEPFTQALLKTGAMAGIDPYLLVQSLVPAATEAPEFVVVTVLILHRRPGQALAILLAAAVSQWTLALGSLPFAYLAGGAGAPLPLAGRGVIELLLTVATTLMAVAALASLEPDRADAWIILLAFGTQFALPSPGIRIVVTVVLVVFAVDVLSARRREIPGLLTAIWPAHAARGSPDGQR
jgi:cation:H+ antiporter